MQQPNSQVSTVAIITVCMDRDAVEQVVRIAGHLSGKIAHADFEVYLSAARCPHLPQKLATADACIAVVDFDQDPQLASESVSCLHQAFHRKVFVIALSSESDSETPLRIMRSGCAEFLPKPLQAEDFRQAFKRIANRWSASVAPKSAGQVLSFFGSKGGVGTTTLAIHVASFLVQAHKKKTLLIDNHPQLGHVCLYLGIDGTKYHFHELLKNVKRLDRELLSGYVAKHESGLDVLASPDAPSDPGPVDPEAIERTLEFLRGEYDFVLVDAATFFDGSNIAAIRASDQVYIIATPEVGAIRDMSRYVEALLSNNQTLDKFRVVMNRFSSKDAVSSEQIQQAIQLPLMFKIPNSYSELVKAINAGRPIQAKSKGAFSEQIGKWSDGLVGPVGASKRTDKKRFSLWK